MTAPSAMKRARSGNSLTSGTRASAFQALECSMSSWACRAKYLRASGETPSRLRPASTQATRVGAVSSTTPRAPIDCQV
jgi:hypothetical protein